MTRVTSHRSATPAHITGHCSPTQCKSPYNVCIMLRIRNAGKVNLAWRKFPSKGYIHVYIGNISGRQLDSQWLYFEKNTNPGKAGCQAILTYDC